MSLHSLTCYPVKFKRTLTSECNELNVAPYIDAFLLEIFEFASVTLGAIAAPLGWKQQRYQYQVMLAIRESSC